MLPIKVAKKLIKNLTPIAKLVKEFPAIEIELSQELTPEKVLDAANAIKQGNDLWGCLHDDEGPAYYMEKGDIQFVYHPMTKKIYFSS